MPLYFQQYITTIWIFVLEYCRSGVYELRNILSDYFVKQGMRKLNLTSYTILLIESLTYSR